MNSFLGNFEQINWGGGGERGVRGEIQLQSTLKNSYGMCTVLYALTFTYSFYYYETGRSLDTC